MQEDIKFFLSFVWWQRNKKEKKTVPKNDENMLYAKQSLGISCDLIRQKKCFTTFRHFSKQRTTEKYCHFKKIDKLWLKIDALKWTNTYEHIHIHTYAYIRIHIYIHSKCIFPLSVTAILPCLHSLCQNIYRLLCKHTYKHTYEYVCSCSCLPSYLQVKL